MVEVKAYQSFSKAVYVDGAVVPRQTLDDPIIYDGLVQFDCLTDPKLRGTHDFSKYEKYQAKPPITKTNENGLLVTTFYLIYNEHRTNTSSLGN